MCRQKIKYLFYLIHFLICLGVSNCDSDDVPILGCGGFVKSSVNLDYSKVIIKLYTTQGIQKYATDCAPNNGYYFFPLEDKGDYVLKVEPPSGWHFEPNQVELKVDGSSDACSMQKDIDFNFKGFTIYGKVTSHGVSSGPAGVDIILRNKKSREILLKTNTEENGLFRFEEVMPGDYIIEASHPTWKIKSPGTLDVSIKNDNVDLTSSSIKSALSVLGYEVEGLVKSDGESIKNVIFALFSTDGRQKDTIQGCDSSPIETLKTQHKHARYDCHVISDERGVFKFPSVPVGKYKLIPIYRGTNIKFDVKPSEVDFEVKHDNVRVETVFNVEGFSVSGRVLEKVNGLGIANAQVTLVDEISKRENKLITTDKDGIFHFENMKTGEYTLLVKAKSIYFTPLKVKISPTTPRIQDIVPSGFDVCGHVFFKANQIEVTIIAENSKLNTKKSTSTDNEGKFCLSLEAGTYELKVMPSEDRKGVHFNPKAQSITVTSAPIDNLKFFQFTASVSGRIISKVKVDSNIEIRLTNQDTNEFTNWKSSSLQSSNTQADQVTFKFDQVLPGQYTLVILKDFNSWCWKKDSFSFEITDSNLSDIEFQHVGYMMALQFSHSTSLRIKYPSSRSEEIKLEKDGQHLRHCVDETGIYSITPIGCHKFSETNQEVITFDTNKDSGKLITRNAVKHRLSALVVTNSNVSDISIMVKIKSAGNEETSEKINLIENKELRVKNANNQIIFTYPLILFLKPMVQVMLEPSSSQLLFKPMSHEINFENQCLENAVTFSGKTGLFINGEIIPKLEGVNIEIKNNENVLVTTTTDSHGKYIAGPFDSEFVLQVDAQKEGYVLKPVDGKLGHFEALKMASLIIQIKTEDNQPLPGVLISLSGGADNFRKNSITSLNGELNLNELHSGQYFMRVMMKEYEFEPSSKMIDVSQGSTVRIEVKAKKVAFSYFGSTVSLNGDAANGVSVEARGVRNVIDSQLITCNVLQEDAVSESNGTFRIKGLRPECEYEVQLKSNDEKNNGIERSIPAKQIVRVKDSDIYGDKLITIRRWTHMDVSGDVLSTQSLLSSVKVRLFAEVNPEQPLSTVALGPNAFFYFGSIPIDNRSYFIRLESSLSANIYDLESIPLTRSFKANTTFTHFTFNFNPKLRNANSNINDHELGSQNSVYTLPFIFILTLLIFNYSKISPYMNQLLELAMKLTNTLNVRNLERESSPGGTKRSKTKARKI